VLLLLTLGALPGLIVARLSRSDAVRESGGLLETLMHCEGLWELCQGAPVTKDWHTTASAAPEQVDG